MLVEEWWVPCLPTPDATGSLAVENESTNQTVGGGLLTAIPQVREVVRRSRRNSARSVLSYQVPLQTMRLRWKVADLRGMRPLMLHPISNRLCFVTLHFSWESSELAEALFRHTPGNLLMSSFTKSF